MVIVEGSISALYLFDVAEEVDLAALPRLLQAQASPARLAPKPFTPAYVQYQQPPIVLDGEALQLPGLAPLRARVKVFDYGVISFALSEPVSGGWEALDATGQRLGALEAQVQGWCDQLRTQLAPCLVKSHQPLLSEDYLVYAITRLGDAVSADALLASDGDAIVSLLLGERQPLSRQQRDRVLRRVRAGTTRFAGQRNVRAAQQLHALFIEVNELTDKTENALKMVGDVYAARLYSLVASRLGLEHWKQNVEEKLDTLDDIYRFTVDQTQMSRGHLLELTIILILILELALVFMGIMQ